MIGQRIKERRIKNGLTQAALAEKIGVTQQSVGQWEKDRTSPDSENFKQLSLVLGCTEDYLKGLVDKPDYIYLAPTLLGDGKSSSIHKNEYIKWATIIASGKLKKETSVLYKAGEMYRVPVVGKIPAGAPCRAFENIEDYEAIPREWLNGHPEEYFVLNVEGDSMEGARIFDGDRALLRKTPDFENGQICAVGIINDPTEHYATLKHVHSIDATYVELIPDNPKYPRIKIERKNICIYGILKKIIRNY